MIRTRTARLCVPLFWLACDRGSPASAQLPSAASPPVAQAKLAVPEAAKPAEKAPAQSQGGDLLALDAQGKVQILKGATVELRCLQNKPKERGCSVNLQVRVERDGKRVSLTSSETVLPGLHKAALGFGAGSSLGQSTLDLIPIPKRGGALIRIKIQATGDRINKQAVTEVTWYILSLREPEGASTFKPVLNYQENKSSTHEDEENTRIKMATATTAERKKTTCRGFPDVLLRTSESVTRGRDSPEETQSESLYRWNGTEYAPATGQAAPECSQPD